MINNDYVTTPLNELPVKIRNVVNDLVVRYPTHKIDPDGFTITTSPDITLKQIMPCCFGEILVTITGDSVKIVVTPVICDSRELTYYLSDN